LFAKIIENEFLQLSQLTNVWVIFFLNFIVIIYCYYLNASSVLKNE